MSRPKLQRARVTKLVTAEIRRFIKRGESEIIDDLLTHGLGWISNYSTRTDADLARALLALLPIADDTNFEHVADSTIRHREMLKGLRVEIAEETARRILAPLGVRYATCGCLEAYAGDSCCSNAVDARRAA